MYTILVTKVVERRLRLRRNLQTAHLVNEYWELERISRLEDEERIAHYESTPEHYFLELLDRGNVARIGRDHFNELLRKV